MALRVWFLSNFSPKRVDFFFTLAWHWLWAPYIALGILSIRNNFFRIKIGKFVAYFNYLRKCKPFLVSCIHILEPCTNFQDRVSIFLSGPKKSMNNH